MDLASPLLDRPPRSLCILRLSAIGDAIHVVPVIRTLQTYWPESSITWIVGALEHSLVGDLPGVDFVVFDKSRRWKAYGELRTSLRHRDFDLLLDLQTSMRGNLAALMIRAPVKLGFDRERAKDFQWMFTSHRIPAVRGRHVLDGFFGFLETLGIRERVLRWDIPIPEEARRLAREALPAGTRTLVVNPCANLRLRNWRTWNPEGYAAVADHAAARHGLRVVLTGGPAPREAEFGREILQRCRGSAPLNLIGRTSLKELLAVLERAAVLLAPDTGPAHMATAVGTPVIGLYATTNPLRARAYLSGRWVVDKYPEALYAEYGLKVEEAPWGKRVRNPEAMNRIRVRDVTDMLDAFVADRIEREGVSRRS